MNLQETLNKIETMRTTVNAELAEGKQPSVAVKT